VRRFTATDPILDSNRMHKTYVNCEKLDETRDITKKVFHNFHNIQV